MRRIVAVTGLALLVAAPANAVDTGFYAGVDVGQYSRDLDSNGLSQQVDSALGDLGLTISNASSDTSEDGFTYVGDGSTGEASVDRIAFVAIVRF